MMHPLIDDLLEVVMASWSQSRAGEPFPSEAECRAAADSLAEALRTCGGNPSKIADLSILLAVMRELCADRDYALARPLFLVITRGVAALAPV